MANGAATLVAELARALQLVTQLERSLPRSSTTESSCKALALEARSSLQTAILIAKSNELDDRDQQQHATAVHGPPPSSAFKDHNQKKMVNIRKTPLKWTQQVRHIAGEGRVEEQPVDDGHRWRKYGQTDILGAKHPRAYYRCTHRNTQGCLATKQVHRSDDDPLLFDITYVGTHSCLQGPRRGPASAPQHKPADSGAANGRLLLQQEVQASSSSPPPPPPPPTLASMLVWNELEMQPAPVTSESTYFSMSPYHALEENDIGIFGGGMKLQNLDSDPTNVGSEAGHPATTAAASQVHMDLMLDELDLDPDFQFDASSFF